jgi:1-acyl-sn-glycerol-3-phosphate acyltransferase
MRHVRAIIRLLQVSIATVTIYLVYVFCLLFVKISGRQSQPLRNRFMTFWAGTIARILNLKVTVKGNPPRAPFFLVSNHLSYLDIVLLFKSLTCTFIARKDVESWPVVGFMARTMGIIFIDRTKKIDVGRVNQIISKSLNKDQGIVLFPEGTTSSGADVLPFRASLLQHPAASDLDVHYASITYETSSQDLPASESVCWWGEISFPAHAYLLAGNKQINCTITFGKETVGHPDRKELADILHKKVKDQFIPVPDQPKESLHS